MSYEDTETKQNRRDALGFAILYAGCIVATITYAVLSN